MGEQDGYSSETWKFGWWVTRVEKIVVLDWGRYQMVVNGCLEDLEGSMRLKMWKLVPRVGEKNRGTN